ncbi:tumor necrosis factor receptor superfamily member 6B-like isoform X2 [Melanotaenia boesemani]|nr:tumor necrosis factor receptor superfamily member 6B-like isoform X2 [Melanotaenia boesemani]
MLSLAVLFLLSGVLWESSAEDLIPTYDYQDPYTWETFKCNKCPPGTHIAAHCTATTPTKCEPCRSDHFTELWNYLPRCLYCNICTQKQEVETECSPVRNRVCRCKEGYYWVDDFCVSHTQCGPGYGVQARGTSQKDTVCEKCTNGYFSKSSSALDSCVKHQECANGEQVLLHGSAAEDTLCGSCEDLANKGEIFRTFLSAFFSKNLKRVRQQKRFVSRIICKSGQESCEDDVLHQDGGLLLDQIKAWVAHIPVKKLQHLPTELKDAHLSSIAEKLNKRLNDIKHFPNCSIIV